MRYLLIIILILLFIFFLFGCESDKKAKERDAPQVIKNAHEIIYDGCEYVWFNSGGWSWGGHKGNCENPIHTRRDSL